MKRLTVLAATFAGALPLASAADEGKSIAFLSASSANTWLGASKVEMDKIAGANGARITEFDAQFDPSKQAIQMQDVIASGQYDGVIVTAINGPGLIPDIQAALDEGLKVVVLNQVVGTDLTTSDPQVDGVSASVLAAPFRTGERMGQLVVQACESMTPCEVVYFYGIKGIPLDTALKDGFDAVVGAQPNIQIVAEGEGKYLGPDQGLIATQDILQVQPDFDVLVGPDQAVQGAQIALEDEGMLSNVRLIGFGGSQAGIDGIASGAWFGGVMGAPGTEGRLAMQAMLDALDSGAMSGGIDPLSKLPHDGLVTQQTVGDFTAEWGG